MPIRSVGATRALVTSCILACVACSDVPEVDSPLGEGAEQTAGPVEALGSTSQTLEDPDGLITPSFVSSYIPVDLLVVLNDFKKLAGFYSDAKTAFAITRKAAELLGIVDAENPNEQFDRLAEAIFASSRVVDWKVTAGFLETWRGQAKWAFDTVASGVPVRRGDNVDEASGSPVRSIMGATEMAFYRPFQDSATNGSWRIVVPDRAKPDPNHGNQAYDWRLGVPLLIELVTYRIHAIAAMNPNFRWDDSATGFKKELREMRDFAVKQRDKMLSGIRCVDSSGVRPLGAGQVCADINTGIYAASSNGIWHTWPSKETTTEVMQRVRSQLIRAMPVHQLQSLIDTLTFYISGKQDLTEANADIRVASNPSLCLDIRNGDPAPGTPLWTWPCTGNVAQHWQYDRANGTIYNPDYGECLDVLPRERRYPGQVPQSNPVLGFSDGSQVVSNWCDGSGGQQWTYNHDSKTLQNAFGLVIRASSSPATSAPPAQALVTAFAGPPHAGFVTEQWEATQRTIKKHSAPLFRYPNGELHAWDTIWGPRYRDIYLGAADLSWQAVATGDFNADRHADILWRNETYSYVSTWLLDGQLQVLDYPPGVDHAPTGQPWTGDLDGNGVSDIVWTRGGWQASGAGAGYYAVTETWWMNSSSTEPSLMDIRPSTQERVIAVGDFNGDAAHVADRIYMSKDNVMRIALAGGSSTSWQVGSWEAIGVGDFNADGTDDVLFFEPGGSSVFVGVMVNGRPTPSTVLGSVPPSTGWTIQGAGDIDADGISDIIWRHSNGTMGYWLMNNATSVRDYPSIWVSPDIAYSGVMPIEAAR